MNRNKVLKFAIVGLGVMGLNHFKTLSAIKGIDVEAVVDLRFEKEMQIDKNIKHNRLNSVDWSKIDGIVIATPTSTHLEIVSELSSLSIPMLIEKPLAGSHLEGLEIARMCKQSGTKCFVGLVERFNPAINISKILIDDHIDARVLQYESVRVGPRPLRVSDVDVVQDLVTHDLDLFKFMLEDEPKNLISFGFSLEGDLIDGTVITGQSTSRTIFSHTINWFSPEKRRIVKITTTKGILNVNLITREVNWTSFEPERRENVKIQTKIAKFMSGEEKNRQALELELSAFASAIIGIEDKHLASIEDGLAVTKLVDQIRVSVGIQLNE